MAKDFGTVPLCFLEAVDRFRNPRAQVHRTAAGWEGISAKEMLRRVAGLARALASLGIQSGDRVGLFAANCPEWATADFAIQGLGAVTVPVYFHESAERLVYILKDSGARVVFASREEQVRLVAECRPRLPEVEHVISAEAPSDLQGENLRYERLIEAAGDAEISEYRRGVAGLAANQLATIIYTSGTTGEPKGVMLSHANLSSNAMTSSEEFGMSPSDVALSMLPLAHIYERTADYSYIFRGVSVAYLAQLENAAQALLEVRPTITAAVPRFYEKIYASVIEKGRRETDVKRKIFDSALRVAAEAVPWRAYGKPVSAGVKLRWRIADKLVYSKIRANLGGRLRSCSSGGGPLAPELIEFFWSIKVPVYQGYGLTETSPVVTANTPKTNKVGTVGRPLPDVQVRIAGDGEILVKGPCVMQGYYRKPEQTAEVLTPDGWLSSGDIGKVDENGFLIITDRKKELLKTAGGKFVAPAPIENALKTSPFVANAMVVGDGRKFVSVLIVPNFANIEAEARRAGHEIAAAPAKIASEVWVRDLLSRELERLTASLAQYEKPKRFALLDQDFTYPNGQLTYTLKLKRRVIEKQFEDLIARLYADVEEPRPQHLA
jgi:long-chain acyl-CoA synthetase